MDFRAKYALLAVFLGITLMMPMYAGSAISTPRLISSVRESTNGAPNIQAIEVMDSYVDPWGGVYNVVTGAYNATKYEYSHILALENIVKNQMETKKGFVSISSLELSGMTVFPNGVVGPPQAILEVIVTPVMVVPTNRSLVHMADLSQVDAISIAGEVVAAYNTALSISLQRLMIVEQYRSYYFNLGVSPGVSLHGNSYFITYLGILTAAQGTTAMNAMLTRLANLGGLMSIVGAPNWPDIMTAAAEIYVPFHYMPHWQEIDSIVTDMFGNMNTPCLQSSNANDTTVLQSLVEGTAAFNYPGYVNAVSGNETYSLKTHVGFTSNIENKMQEDPSAMSISLIGGEAPGPLTVYGIPSSWMTINDQFRLPGSIPIDDFTIPANSTISDAIRMILSSLPREAAFYWNEMVGGLDPYAVDPFIDTYFSYPGPFPDARVMLLGLNYTLETPVTDMNYDLLALEMKSAGLTPDTLISKINSTLASVSPVGALVKAFVDYFDAYHLLDILQPSSYSSAPAFAASLNSFITAFENVVHDLAGFEVTTEFKTKEGIATFVEEHWGIALQALWTAMAANDSIGVKSAFHAILDANNLQKHTTPYLMADLGSSLLSGIGFMFGANFNGTAFLPLSASDLTLTFDSDPASLSITGPYLAIVKGPSTRTLTAGENITYTINVHNYGDATAYDVKVLDGMCAGLDGDRPYYWTKSTLAAGATWEFTYQVKANTAGLYMDMPALCVYFNQSLSTFNPSANWTGSARYTMSAFGYQINVQGGGWFPSTIFGIPTLYVIAGVGGVAAVGVALLIIRRRA